MMRSKTMVLAAGLAVCGGVPGGARAQGEDVPSVTTARFELRSDIRVGLHHFLLDWAAADAGEWPPFAPPLVERETGLEELPAADRETWSGAVRAYAASVGRSLLFDDGLLALRDWAAGVGPMDAVPEEDLPLAEALEGALPVYRRHWWPGHDARNRAWIDAVAPVLRETEEGMAERLAAAYGGSWPDARIPADVVAYANPVGAYSTGGRVTLASGDRDNAMPGAIELLFHEASHVGSLEGPLRAALERAFERAGAEEPDRLWHDVIFVTSGEIARIVLEESGRPGYRHYGETTGVYTRAPRWEAELPAFETHWLPFVRSGAAEAQMREAAFEGLARALAEAPPE